MRYSWIPLLEQKNVYHYSNIHMRIKYRLTDIEGFFNSRTNLGLYQIHKQNKHLYIYIDNSTFDSLIILYLHLQTWSGELLANPYLHT